MRAKFIGEIGRPATDGVVIAGLAFRKDQELILTALQVVTLRAHPQFGQFEFAISGTAKVATAMPVKKSRLLATPKKRRAERHK